jgi:hypothetical protein
MGSEEFGDEFEKFGDSEQFLLAISGGREEGRKVMLRFYTGQKLQRCRGAEVLHTGGFFRPVQVRLLAAPAGAALLEICQDAFNLFER